MLTLKNINTVNKTTIENSILESQNLIDSLDRHDQGFTQMIDTLITFYRIEKQALYEILVNNLSNYDLSKNEITFNDLKSMSKLSALSLMIPTIKPILYKRNLEDEKEFEDDSYQVGPFDLDHLRQVA